MSRDASLTDAKLSKGTLYPVLLAEIDWPGGMVRVWTGYGSLSWNSQTWLGTGDLGSVSAVQESSDGTANGLTLTLNGIKAANIVEILSNSVQGKSAKLYFGLLASPGVWDIEPYCVFDGFIDFPRIEDTGDRATIHLQLEKEFIDQRAQSRRSTDQDQKIDYPNDKGFEYVAGLANKTILWGRVIASTSTVPGGSSGVDGSNLIHNAVK